MAEPPVENIDGVPEIMGNYDTTKNLQNFKPDAELKDTKEKKLAPAMAEGQAFAAKDKTAVDRLSDFIFQTGIQLRSATNTARADKHEYIGADSNASEQLRKIAFQTSSLPVEPTLQAEKVEPTLQAKKPDA
jgi:hypothetical protein